MPVWASVWFGNCKGGQQAGIEVLQCPIQACLCSQIPLQDTHILTQMPVGHAKGIETVFGIQVRGPLGFTHFLTVQIADQSDMAICRRRHAQLLLQENLPRRRAKKIRASYRLADALRGIVHHDCQLVSEIAIGALQHEVAT